MKRRSLLLAAGSSVTGAAVGCAGERPPAEDAVTLTPPVPPSQTAVGVVASASASSESELPGKDWVVGAYLPLTGPDGQFGIETRQGIDLAVERLNAAGGVRGRPLRIALGDDKSSHAEVPKVVRELIERDRAVALLGEIASARSVPGALMSKQKRVPMITPSSTNASVTQVSEYAFRSCFIDEVQGTAAAEFAVSLRKKRKLAIVFGGNDLYSTLLAETFRNAAKAFGATVVVEEKVQDTTIDFTSVVKALKAARPDMIYAPLYYSQMIGLGHAAKQSGIKGEMFLGGDGWTGEQMLLDQLEGAYFTDHWAAGFPTATSKRFVEAHREKYQTAPTSLAAAAYDAVLLLADAMKRARSLRGDELREAIATTRAFPGVTGPITINDARNSDKPITIVQIANKTTRYVDVVGPGADTVRAEAKSAAP